VFLIGITGSGVHLTSYTMGTGGSFPGVKQPGREAATHLQRVPRSRKCGFIHPLPHTPSWRSAYLVKHGDNFTFTSLELAAAAPVTLTNAWKESRNRITYSGAKFSTVGRCFPANANCVVKCNCEEKNSIRSPVLLKNTVMTFR
jgi:hypothetical protein